MTDHAIAGTSVHLPLSSTVPLAAELAAVRAAGFDGAELPIPRLRSWLRSGGTVSDVRHWLGGLHVTMLDVLMPIEALGARGRLVSACGRWAAVAARLGCPAIQVVALDGFATPSWPGQREVLVRSLRALSRAAAPHGVRLGLEPVCFSPVRRLDMACEVIDAVGRDACGLVLDTWHLWVTGTAWTEVAALDPAQIVTVQVGDCGPRRGQEWSDGDRTAMPGRGLVPVTDAAAAVRRTGYRGFWSAEMEPGPGDPLAHYQALRQHLLDVVGRGAAMDMAQEG